MSWRVSRPKKVWKVTVGSEKEKYECAIGTSVLLTLLFAYDGVVMGLPHLNFWMYLVLPHVVLAVATLAFVWKRGVFNDYPVGYIIGFTAILATCDEPSTKFSSR